jgi:hypothetical protein
MKPVIRFTSLPFVGDMVGVVSGVVQQAPDNYKIALYIKVNRGWWNKPMFSRRDTFITKKGTFSNKTVTGGLDQKATSIIAFLVPKNFQIPTAYYAPYLPDSLYRDAAAWAEVYRRTKKGLNEGLGYTFKS